LNGNELDQGENVYNTKAIPIFYVVSDADTTMIEKLIHGIYVISCFVEVLMNRIPIRIIHFIYGISFPILYGVTT
jgi:hypothetical protein